MKMAFATLLGAEASRFCSGKLPAAAGLLCSLVASSTLAQTHHVENAETPLAPARPSPHPAPEAMPQQVPSTVENEPTALDGLPASIDTCRSAIDTAQKMTRDFPPGLLLAIAETESGRSVNGDFGPWPWTLNIAGEGRFFDSPGAALDAAQTALVDGDGNVDLGCMQISETWHSWAFPDLETMLDPLENAGYAASFLSSLFATHGNWRDAISHYHSANPARGFAYAERVLTNWRRNPEAVDFIVADESLSDVSRLAGNLVDLAEIGEIESEYFVAVVVSERYEVADAFAVKGADGSLYVSLSDLADVPFQDRYSLPLVLYGDTVLVDLGAAPSYDASLDEEANLLRITTPGEVFAKQEFQSGDVVKPEEISQRQPGGHLNYRIAGSFSDDEPLNLSAVFSAVGYWDNRTFRASALVDDDLKWKRLSTSLTVDNFEKRRQLIIGDTTTPAGRGWGGSHPIFGLNWGTNLNLDPSFSALPDYSIFGVTDIPAVARFLVDGESVRETALEPGAYEFSNLPFPDQFGDMTVAVEDIQGQVRYFKVPYIRIPDLYRVGLHTFNYGIGFKKEESDNPLGGYGNLVAAATHRVGFTDTFTGEIHGEISPGSVALGVSGDFALLDANRFISTTLAASYSALGTGFQAGVSYGSIKRDAPSLFSGSLQFRSEDFYLGTVKPTSLADREATRWSLRLASSFGGALPFTLNYDYRDTWAGDATHSLSAGRTWSLSEGWSLSASGSYSLRSDDRSGSITIGLSKSFGKKNAVHAHVNGAYSNGSRNLDVSLRRPKRSGTGLGYYGKISNEPNSGRIREASLGLEGESEKLNYAANVQVLKDSFDVNATVSGSIGYLDGETFMAASLNSPYLLARSGDARELPIHLNHNLLGETNSDGLLVGDGLVPFARNRVEFKPEDLGFDFSISGVEYTKTIVPVSIGGYVAEFEVKEQFPATVILVDDTGAPLPSGAVVFNTETDEAAGVTVDGMVYFENVQDGQRLEADLGRFGSCETVLRLEPDLAKFDEVGPFSCE